MKAMFRSLEIRNFRLFFAGQFLSQVGTWLTQIAGIMLVNQETDGALPLGLLTVFQFGPMLLIGPCAGVVADRLDKRRLLMVVQVVAMAKSAALGAVAFADHPNLALFFAISAVGGLATALDNPARRAFVVEMVPESHVQNAVSLNSAVMTSSRIFGPALAGLLVSTVGFGWTFLVDAISYVAVLWSLSRIDVAGLRSSPVLAKGKGQVVAGLRYLRSVPVLWISMVVMAIIGTLTFNFSVTFPVFIEESLGGSSTDFTILFSVTSIGSLTGALLTARRTTVELRDVLATALFYGLAMSALSAAPNLPAAYVLGSFVGLGGIAFLTTSTAIVQLRADPMMRGRVLGIQAMVFLGSTPVGGPILGFVVDLTNARVGVLVGGVAALFAAGLGVAMARRNVRSESKVEGSLGVPPELAASQ